MHGINKDNNNSSKKQTASKLKLNELGLCSNFYVLILCRRHLAKVRNVNCWQKAKKRLHG